MSNFNGPSTFNVRINDGPVYQLTACTGVYKHVAQAAIAMLPWRQCEEDYLPDHIEISPTGWEPPLSPDEVEEYTNRFWVVEDEYRNVVLMNRFRTHQWMRDLGFVEEFYQPEQYAELLRKRSNSRK